MRSDFRPSTVAGTKEAAALRDFDWTPCRLWVIRVGRSRQRTRPMSALLQKRTISRSSR